MDAHSTQTDALPTPAADDLTERIQYRIPTCPIPIFIALTLGVFLRVAWLNDKPLWEDEAWTFVTAISDRPLLDLVGADPHPLSFYWLTRQMPAGFLSSDWAFRLPHAIASCLALLLIPAVFRRCLSDNGPAPAPGATAESVESLIRWCVLGFALLPLNVRYAQEARSYALCQLAGVLVLLAYLQCRNRCSRMTMLGLCIATTASMHIDGFGWITPFIVGLHALMSIRHADARRSILAIAIGCVAAFPYIGYRIVHMAKAGEMHAVGSGRLGKAFAARWLELSPVGIAFDPIPSKYQFVIWFAAGVAAIVFLVGISTHVRKQKDERRRLMPLLFVVPFAALTCLSIAADEIYIFRKYLIPTAPAVVLLFAMGFFRLTRGSFVCACIVLLTVPLGVSLAGNMRPGDRADWRSLYEKMRENIAENDGFAQQQHLNYPGYSFGPLQSYAWRDHRRINSDRLFEFTAPQDAAKAVDQFAATLGTGRVWTITTNWMADDQMPDLSAFADKRVECKVRGCRATLWKIQQRESDAGSPSINDR